MADPDGLTSLEVDPLARVHPSHADGANLVPVDDGDLRANSDFRRRPDNADREDVPLRMKVFDFDAERALLPQDFATSEGQSDEPALRAGTELRPAPNQARERPATGPPRPVHHCGPHRPELETGE